REIERPASPLDSGGSSKSPCFKASMEHSRHRSAGHVAAGNGFESGEVRKSNEKTTTGPTGPDGVEHRSGSAWSSNNNTGDDDDDDDDDDDKGATDYDSFGFGSEDEEAEIFGSASCCSGSSSDDDRGSFYGANEDHGGNYGYNYGHDDDDDEKTREGRRRRRGRLAASEEGRGGDGRSVDNLSLSGNSSDWTPLRGADLVGGASRRSSPSWSCREDRIPERFSEAADADEAFSSHDEGARITAVNALDKTTEACISALRNAMLVSAESGVVAPGEHHESLPCRASPSWTGDGRAYVGRGAVVGGSANPEDGLKALEGFVHDTAMLEGAVEGVERGRGGVRTAALRGDGGTAAEEGFFVKISFVDGGLASTTDAMFRCKTLLHTTGSSTPETCSAGSIGGGWPDGEFQCETFHGGRLGELANAAVLFSVHRRRCGNRGATSRGLDREGFLGQASLSGVVLPVRNAVLGLRPVSIAPEPPKSGVDKEGAATGTHARSSINVSSDSDNDCIIRKGTDNGSWRLLRGEVSGAFRAADRRGRVEAAGDTPLVLRLRLSVSLSLKP
ncbi:unnamed protein product, partial [Ectocarpus fasciculatus]